ncbi:MAG: HAD-IIIC family phosphatase, partial [Clostridia bacterium]|nr:HAD-IIIC family phosphatase [Clostridia bacterium]
MVTIKYIKLEKNCSLDMEGLPIYKAAVLGNCATQHMATALRGYAYEMGINLNVYDADYNQIEAQVMDPGSELYTYAPDFVLLFMCTEKLYDTFCAAKQEEKRYFAEHTIEKIRGYIERINQQIKTNILQFNFVQQDDGVFGNYANQTEDSFLFQLRKLNYLLMQEALTIKNYFIVDLDRLQSIYGALELHSEKLYYVAKMPISTRMLPETAKQVMDVFMSIRGRIKKCVILDLDNTLWGGVIGDDGMENIQIGELGLGQAFSRLQQWLLELKKRGIILAVCSKNEEATAKEPFINHPEMVLRLDDISMFVANWEDKASNIKYIQETLNIGMDSIVFLDDNPFERNLVKSVIPQITVPELPEDPSEYLNFLQKLNLFETASYSKADADRTKQYQEEIKRTSLQKVYGTYEEYLQSLNMTAKANPFDTFHFSRIAQLTQRSNQFNLRTVRYTETEIEALSKSDDHITLYFTLKDQFGDYGLI